MYKVRKLGRVQIKNHIFTPLCKFGWIEKNDFLKFQKLLVPENIHPRIYGTLFFTLLILIEDRDGTEKRQSDE